MLKLEYHNSNNIEDFIFQDSFYGVEYFDTDITLINLEYEKEILTNGNEEETVINTILKETFSIQFNAKNHFLETLKIIPFCDTVTITAESGKIYEAKDLTIEAGHFTGSTYQTVISFYTNKIISRGVNILPNEISAGSVLLQVTESVTVLPSTLSYWLNILYTTPTGDKIMNYIDGAWIEKYTNEGDTILNQDNGLFYYKNGTSFAYVNNPDTYSYDAPSEEMYVKAFVMEGTFVELEYNILASGGTFVSLGYFSADDINAGIAIKLTVASVNQLRMNVQTHTFEMGMIDF